MTICISAICTEGSEEHIVFAVDHMITTGIGEFEHNSNKYSSITENIVGMISGNALLADYLWGDDYSGKTYSEIQHVLENKFKQKRLEKIQKEILDVYSIDFDYVRESLKNQIVNDFQQNILLSITKTKLNTAVLLIGFENDKAKISEISETGIISFNQINFHPIGSGSIQAQNTLLFQKHSKDNDLKTTLYNVYKAKKNAEVMQGVGKETDMGYLNKNGIKMLNDNDIKILDEIYNIELNYGKTHEKLNELDV